METDDRPAPWTQTEEALWYEVLVRCIYGGMRPETARERVAVLSPYGWAFADLIHDRWRVAAEGVRDRALRSAR